MSHSDERSRSEEISPQLLCIITELSRYLCANEEGSRVLYPPPHHLVPSSETGTWKEKKSNAISLIRGIKRVALIGIIICD